MAEGGGSTGGRTVQQDMMRGQGARFREPRRHRLWPWILVAALVTFGGAFTVVNYFVMPSAVHHGSEVPVPDVVGLPFATAQDLLTQSGLRVTRAGEAPSEDIPRDRVLAADPAAGTMVKQGRMVALTLSLGPEMVKVPLLGGQSLRRAQLLLEGAGLAAGRIGYAYSDSIPRGLVIASSPPAESTAAPGGVVDLRVSLGPPPTAAAMPDVRGWRVDGVEELLRGQGFLVSVQGLATDDPGDAIVADQYPPPGSPVAPGDSVLLVAGH